MTASSAFSFTCASTPAVNLPQLLPNAPQRLQPDIFLAGMARVYPPFCVGELTHASRRDCLPSVGEPGRELFAQAAKGTAAEGGGVFCVSTVPGKHAFRASQNAKKAPSWVPFLLVARRGFEPLLPG